MGGIENRGRSVGNVAWLGVLAIMALETAAVATVAKADLTVEALAAPAVTGVGPYYQDLTDALQKFAEGDYEAAYEHLESARKSTPRLAPPEIMMARMYFDAQMPAPGIALLEKVARSAPDDPEALVMLAEAALASGRLTEAGLLYAKVAPTVEAFRTNTKRREDLQFRLLTGSSLIAESDGDLAAAQKNLEELVRANPNNANTHQRLGRVLFKLNKGREAYEQFKLAADADPRMPPAELAMAQLFSDKENAEKWINHALERSGDDARTHLAVGQFRLRENRIDEAKVHADKALELDPDGLDANLLAGMVARMQTDYPKAAKHLGAAHLLSPADPLIVDNLALVLIELPDDQSHRRAMQFAKLNLQQNPTAIDQLATFGWISYRLGQRADAERALIAAYKACLAKYDSQMKADMGYYLGAMYAANGKYSNATTLLRNALNSNTPFAYRKPARELLDKVQKLAAQQAETDSKGESSSQ
jgi:tetratricopeptide (TPR) repeat protein